MAEQRAKQSNPISTGGGGTNFEISVQTYFAMHIITGDELPFFKTAKVVKMKLQGHYDGYNTDDCIVFGNDGRKQLCQIKNSIEITENSTTFRKVITDAWNDYSNSNVLDLEKDQIVLIVSGLSATDINNTRTIIDWARHCENDAEFHKKITKERFSSGEKQKKYQAIKAQLENAKGNALSDYEIWDFLRHYYIHVLDLNSTNAPLWIAVSNLFSRAVGKKGLEHELYHVIAEYNQNAGTVTQEILFRELSINGHVIDSEIFKKIKSHNDIVLASMHNSINGVSIDRSNYITKLDEVLQTNDIVLVAGERGVGKTGIVKSYLEFHDNSSFNVLFRAEEFNKPSINGVFSELNWDLELELLNQVSLGYQSRCIYVESLERILENEYQKAFNDLLTFVSSYSGWKIIASIRDYALQQVLMNFFSVSKLRTEYVTVEKLEESQLRAFFEKQPSTEFDRINSEVFELSRIPIYLDYIVRAVGGGFAISKDDTYRSIKEAIWDCVIKKENERRNGLPLKREKAFIKIAVQRAKQQRYEVAADSFAPEVVQILEEDGLISLHNGCVSITHDVLEDWALERWISRCFSLCAGDYKHFFDEIGFEQSICRAYRLWLIEKFLDKSFLLGFSESILIIGNDENYSIWADEAIAAILFSNKLFDILEKFKKEILSQPQLLKKICFMIRIAAKKPDQSLQRLLDSQRITERSSFVQLKPIGDCWKEAISFLHRNRESLQTESYPHCTRLLSEWIKVISIKQDIIPGAREAGMLALHILLKIIADKYPDVDMLMGLFEVAIICYGSIHDEFDSFVDSVILNEEFRKHSWVIKELAQFMLTDFCCCYVAKYNSKLLIRVAKREWLISEQPQNDGFPYRSHRDNGDFGFNYSYGYKYNEASGYREPFRALFQWNPREAIEFVLELCNMAVNSYNEYCFTGKSEKEKQDILKNITCRIKKDNGVIIEQIATPNYWCAYRGFNVIPGVIRCALMALENYLLDYFSKFSENKEELDSLAEYLITNSNSVMITAVVAAVLIANDKFVGRSDLLLLQNRAFYSMDLSRKANESQSGWFGPSAMGYDIVFHNERKKSNAYKWRTETLETLCFRLQFSELRESILEIIDAIDAEYSDDVLWQLCKHRIDSREFNKTDKNENQIILTNKPVEGNLKRIIDDQEEKNNWIARYSKWIQWSDDYEKHNGDYQLQMLVSDCINELKILIKHYCDTLEDSLEIYLRGIHQTLAILIRDYRNDITEDELQWFVHYIKEPLEMYDGALNRREYRCADIKGIRYLASTLVLLHDHLSFSEYWALLIKMLTSYDYKMRVTVANSVSEYLWGTDAKLAMRFIAVICQFDVHECEHYASRIPSVFGEKLNVQKEKAWIRKTRIKLYNTKDIPKTDLSMDGTTILLAALPTDPVCFDSVKGLFENCIDKVCVVEQKLFKRENFDDNDTEAFYQVSSYNTKQIGNILFHLFDDQLDEIRHTVEKIGLYAPITCSGVMTKYQLLCESNHRYSNYWRFWSMLTNVAKQIAVELNKGDNYQSRKEREMLIEYMYVNCSWQPLDYQNEPVKDGVDYICSFAKETIQNPIVYEGLASLMYHFPDSYLEKGIEVQTDISGDELVANFRRSKNSVFYMENNIYAYITQLDTNIIPAKMYKACCKILNALIKHSSSKAYYIRVKLSQDIGL